MNWWTELPDSEFVHSAPRTCHAPKSRICLFSCYRIKQIQMKTITLKANHHLEAIMAHLAQETGRTRSVIIRDAIYMYDEHLRKAKLKEQRRVASLTVRDDSLHTLEGMGDSVADGL